MLAVFAALRHRSALLSLAALMIAGCEFGPSSTSPTSNLALSGAAFSSTGDALMGRSGHVAARLADGRVLVAGGVNVTTRLASSEIYDPGTGAWSATASMNYPRLGHATATLRDGRVLVMGGHNANISCADAPVGNSAEIYDPAVTPPTWTLTANMNRRRNSPVAVVLADGRVLVAGGGDRCGSVFNTAEIYDPASGTWTLTGNMNVPRQAPAGVLLQDGRVLVAGGYRRVSPDSSLATAEIYNPATGMWTLTGSMGDPRAWTSMDVGAAGFLALLPDGRVLTAGGANRCRACSTASLASAELYDPSRGTWSAAGALAQGRFRHQMAPLSDGFVFVAGGRDGSTIIGSAEVFDPRTNAFVAAGSLVTARYDFTATPLGDARVLIAAGHDATIDLRSAELFTPVLANQPPVANAGDAVSGNEGTAVAFDGRKSFDPEGNSLSFSWDFGDGSAAGSGPTPSHMYADNADYTVTLTVSDGSLSSSATVTARIANVAPVVDAFAGATLTEGQPYAADGSFTDPGADSWTATVDYGDGSGVQLLALSGRTFSLSHVYPAGEAGPFTVVVTVSDGDGGVGTNHASVTVQVNRAPVARVASMVVSGFEGSAVMFDASASSDPDGDPITYSWDFGDGSPAGSGPMPSHMYARNGTYTVHLTVSDGRLSSMLTLTANVANVAPTVTALRGAELLPGEIYAASGSFSDPGADSWTATVDYGDGSGLQPLGLAGHAFALSHVYRAAGTYVVTVTVRDDDGGFGTSRATVVVQSLQQVLDAMRGAVDDLQSSGALQPPTANSWTATLNSVTDKINKGNISGAITELQAFIAKVQSWEDKGRLSEEDAELLLDPARRLLLSLRGLL